MRSDVPEFLRQHRVRLVNNPVYDFQDGLNGLFMFRGPARALLGVLSSTANLPDEPWEHVSVSVKNRCPYWDEMCFVKQLFWRDDECVLQYHPPAAVYVNHHPFCLHLWRHATWQPLVPPPHLVGDPTKLKKTTA